MSLSDLGWPKWLVRQAEAFLAYWHKVESAPRTVCPECQFESNEYRESHTAGCSRAARGKP